MKALARTLVWWPWLDMSIENAPENANNPLQQYGSWPARKAPFERVHVDFAEFRGQAYLVLVDTYTKWIEVAPMSLTSAERTITELRSIIARSGVPKVLVSDNGPQFKSSVFENYEKMNGSLHLTSPAYHPPTNGQAEVAVQVVKKALKKATSGDVRHLDVFLYAYRNIPHSATGKTPAELMLGRRLQTRLDLLCPTDRMHAAPDVARITRKFVVGQRVQARAYNTKKWAYGTVSVVLGPGTYRVRMDNGQVWRRHANQMLDAARASVSSVVRQATTATPITTPHPGVDVLAPGRSTPVATPVTPQLEHHSNQW